MTVIKISLLSFLIFVAGCGKEVNMSSVSSLEKYTSITEGESSQVLKTGTLIRATKNGEADYLQTNDGRFKISPYSSFETMKFISVTPAGSQVAVKFRGTLKNTEIVVEAIELFAGK